MFTWPVQPMKRHKRIIMSHKIVTEIQKKLTCSKIGTANAFHTARLSTTAIRIAIPLVMLNPSPLLGPNLISIRYFDHDAI